MRVHDRAVAIGLVALSFGLCSCAGSTAPRGYLVKAETEQTDAFGGWLELEFLDKRRDDVHGELIAVQPDSVFVLVGEPSSARFVGIPAREIRKIKVRGYDPQYSRYAGWAVAGALSTVSHGFFLALTFPTWVIVGTASASVQSGSADLHYPDIPIEQLRAHARFPDGLPKGLPRGSLRARPLGARR